MNTKRSGNEIWIYVLSGLFLIVVYIPGVLTFFDVLNGITDYESSSSSSPIIPTLVLIFRIALLLVQLLSIKKLNYKPYMIATEIIKFGLIPLYTVGVINMLLSLLLAVVPVFGFMITASVWILFPILGYLLLMIGSASLIISIIKARLEGIISKPVAIALCIASGFFVTDIVALIVFLCVRKKNAPIPPVIDVQASYETNLLSEQESKE